MLIEILVFPGVDELDFVGPLEVFRLAAEAGADFQTRLVSLDGARRVEAAHGLLFEAEGSLTSTQQPGLLVIPGGGWVNRSSQGAWTEAQRGLIPEAIAKAHRSGTTLASVCTGALLIAAAGLLKGRRASTHHSAIEDLRQQGVEIVQARIVDDGDIITAGGVTSGIDLALYLVDRFAGKDISDRVADRLECERRGPVHRVQESRVRSVQ